MGGSGAGFTWSLTSNASGGAINRATGVYTAGSKGNVTDVIEVADSAGNVASVNIAVGPPVAISPSSTMVPAGRTVAFAVMGGSGSGYAWSLLQNNSNATLDPTTGAYKAGLNSGLDIVQAVDSLGNSGLAAITVTAVDGKRPGGGKRVGPAAPDATGATGGPVALPQASGCSLAATRGGYAGFGLGVVGLLLLAAIVRRRLRSVA
jgi:hypothetical protein